MKTACPPLSLTEKTLSAITLLVVLCCGAVLTYVAPEVCSVTAVRVADAASRAPFAMASQVVVTVSTAAGATADVVALEGAPSQNLDVLRETRRWPVRLAVPCGVDMRGAVVHIAAPHHLRPLFARSAEERQATMLESPLLAAAAGTLIAWLAAMLGMRIWLCAVQRRAAALHTE